MDFIGRFENIEYDWSKLQKRIEGLKDLTVTNRSRGLAHTRTSEDLTTNQIELIEEHHADDMKAFGFLSYLKKQQISNSKKITDITPIEIPFQKSLCSGTRFCTIGITIHQTKICPTIIQKAKV